MAEAKKTELTDADGTKTRPMTSITLKRSKITVSFPATITMADMIRAQRAAGTKKEMVPVYLYQQTCLFDGKRLTIGDILDLPMADSSQLALAFFPETDDEDDLGNG